MAGCRNEKRSRVPGFSLDSLSPGAERPTGKRVWNIDLAFSEKCCGTKNLSPVAEISAPKITTSSGAGETEQGMAEGLSLDVCFIFEMANPNGFDEGETENRVRPDSAFLGIPAICA